MVIRGYSRNGGQQAARQAPRTDPMSDSSTILLVDDDEAVRKVLSFPLERDGYAVIQAADGRDVQLTFVEFELLTRLAATPGRVFSRRNLLEALWGSAEFRDPRTIDVHVRHLREKIERDPRNPELILTVRSVGYRFRGR